MQRRTEILLCSDAVRLNHVMLFGWRLFRASTLFHRIVNQRYHQIFQIILTVGEFVTRFQIFDDNFACIRECWWNASNFVGNEHKFFGKQALQNGTAFVADTNDFRVFLSFCTCDQIAMDGNIWTVQQRSAQIMSNRVRWKQINRKIDVGKLFYN